MMQTSRAELKYAVERQREELKALNEVGRLLSSTTEPQELIRLGASYLHQAFPVACCAIWVLPQRKLHLIPFAPVPQVELGTAIRQIRETAARLLNRPVTEEESQCQLSDAAPPSPMSASVSLRSHFSSPLMAKGQPLGLLSVFSGQADAFTKEDHHAMGVIAEQLGAALRNAFLLEQIRRADELKNQLLSIVSHELSTPLTAIKEGINLVLEGALGETSPDQRDFLGTVMENTERLERLIQKVKTATELMTGQTQFACLSFDLRTVLANVQKAYASLAVSRGVQMKLLDYPSPLFWPIDTAHTTEALNQVVENAIHATPKDGHVVLKLLASPAEACIQVTDTGSGIAKELLPSLFDQFQSIGEIHERKMGGVGLGLFIASSLIKGQGGTITVESTVGVGTAMTIHLPKAKTTD